MAKTVLLGSLLLIALSSDGLDLDGWVQDSAEEIKVVGCVAAYDDFLNVAGAPQSKYLIVKITKSIEGSERSQYIKVVYRALHGQRGLPQEMESSDAQWVFTLRRGTDDQACREPVRRWIRTKPQSPVEIPNAEKLVCYLLGPTGFERVNRQVVKNP